MDIKLKLDFKLSIKKKKKTWRAFTKKAQGVAKISSNTSDYIFI